MVSRILLTLLLGAAALRGQDYFHSVVVFESGGSVGSLTFQETSGAHTVGFQPPATIANTVLWTLPAADSSGTQYLASNGSGVLSWGTPTGTVGLADPGANGIVARTALNTTVARTMTVSLPLGITNGDGVSGAPAFTCATCVTAVTASGGLSSSGGTTPAITCSTCMLTGTNDGLIEYAAGSGNVTLNTGYQAVTATVTLARAGVWAIHGVASSGSVLAEDSPMTCTLVINGSGTGAVFYASLSSLTGSEGLGASIAQSWSYTTSASTDTAGIDCKVNSTTGTDTALGTASSILALWIHP